MYDNVMNKFKYGNFKHARYLDDVSKTQFYLNMEITFNDLERGAWYRMAGPTSRLNAMHKFDKEMPDINPISTPPRKNSSWRKTAYKLGDTETGHTSM
jgi:hypothetical protein